MTASPLRAVVFCLCLLALCAPAAPVRADAPVWPDAPAPDGARGFADGALDFVPQADALVAPHAEPALRTRVTASGFEVTVLRDGRAPSTIAFTARALVRGGARLVLGAGRLDAAGARATLARGAVTEWLVNGPDHLEHGADVGVRLPGEVPLRVEIGLAGVLRILLHDATTAWLLLGGGLGGELRYGDLAVYDAAGARLPARFVPGPGGDALTIEVDDAGAAYPLRIDPLLSASWSAAGGQSGMALGLAVTTIGDVNGDGHADFAAGAPTYDLRATEVDAGLVRAWYGGPSGPPASANWVEYGVAGARFGNALAAAGDVNGDGYDDLLVGAPTQATSGGGRGRVYLYYGSASGLAPTAAWTYSSTQGGSELGRAVASADVNGDGYRDIVVGEPYFDTATTDVGRVLVFLGSGSGPATTPAWTGTGAQAWEFYGFAVAGVGDTDGDGYDEVLAGAPYYDEGEYVDVGRARLHFGSAAGVSSRNVFLSGLFTICGLYDCRRDESSYFGFALSAVGDTTGDGLSDFAIGHPYRDASYAAAGSDEGLVDIFAGDADGTPWRFATLPGEDEGDNFGRAVGAAGDVDGDGRADLLVGAPNANSLIFPYANGGALYAVCTTTRGIPGICAEYRGAPGDRLGIAVATAGDVDKDGFADALAGAHLDDTGSVVDDGSVRFYRGAHAEIAAHAATRYYRQGEPGFGATLAAADVDGDGRDEVLVGQPYWTGSTPASVLVEGSDDTTISSVQSNDRFGFALANAGDINGDGRDDVVVGAPSWNGSVSAAGAVAAYYGRLGGFPASMTFDDADWHAFGDADHRSFGTSVAGGDVTGDGHADVLVLGRAFLWFYPGGPDGLPAEPTWRDADIDYLDGQVAFAGDVNGDGFGDVLVGNGKTVVSGQIVGSARLFLGTAAGPQAEPAWTVFGDEPGAGFGFNIAAAGDLDGDGFADLAVSANNSSAIGPNAGRVYVWYGGPAGPSVAPDVTLDPPGVEMMFGSALAGAGDLDGDGHGELAVGAPLLAGAAAYGRTYIYHGGPGGLGTTGALAPCTIDTSLGPEPRHCGRSVAGRFDYDGDGFADLLFGEVRGNDAQDDARYVHLVLAAGEPTDVQPPGKLRQWRLGSPSTRIALHGMSSDDDAFVARMVARTAGGSARVRTEIEVKPYGVPFDGTGTVLSGTSVDVGGDGVDISRTISGLAPGLYRWRARAVSRNPLVRTSPWVTLAGNGSSEWDLRTAGFTPPQGVGPLTVTRAGSGAHLAWPGALNATHYDVVRGPLGALAASGGDFAAATDACLANDTTSLTADDADPPGAGAGSWYLVRAANGAGSGTYDDASPGLAAPRDAGIAAAAVACP